MHRENFGLWSRSDSEDYGAQLLIVYEAPEYVKEELAEADAKLEQKPLVGTRWCSSSTKRIPSRA